MKEELKEALNCLTIGGLKQVACDYREVESNVRKKDGHLEYEISQEDWWYVDRFIDTDSYRFVIITDKEANKTWLSDDIMLYDDDCEIAITDIDELEEFIKEMEG